MIEDESVSDALQLEKNPYRPGVGLQPPYLAGRSEDINRFKHILKNAPEIPGNVRMTGLRGVGKTVLLQKFHDLAEELGWAALMVEIEPRHNSDSSLIEMLQSKLIPLDEQLSTAVKLRHKVADVAHATRKAAKMSYEGYTWSLGGDLDPVTTDLAKSLLETVKIAKSSNHLGLVLLLDEAQILVDDKSSNGNHSLSLLIASFASLQKQGVPICLCLCGLPTLAVNLLGARTYTERMFQGIQIGSLTSPDDTNALIKPLEKSKISADPLAIKKIIDDVDGYPYFLQLWGAELWEATRDSGSHLMTVDILSEIEDRIQQRLDIDFYAPRIDSLTPAEQDLILASAQCSYPPLKVSELNAISSKSDKNVNVLLGRIVKENIIYRERKGQYFYTAPKFRDFLLRKIKHEQ